MLCAEVVRLGLLTSHAMANAVLSFSRLVRPVVLDTFEAKDVGFNVDKALLFLTLEGQQTAKQSWAFHPQDRKKPRPVHLQLDGMCLAIADYLAIMSLVTVAA